MKKQNKVYSASDFASANASVVVESSWWAVDNIDFTRIGEVSKAPLFILELKRIVSGDNSAPEGYEDGSMEMEPNRTYFVREGRPLYNALFELWEATDGDKDEFIAYAMKQYSRKSYRGRVEKLTGISYTTTSRRGTTIQKSSTEVWYPEALSEGRVLDDFIFLCNKGVYTPNIEENKEVDLSKIDPNIIAAIKTMIK